MGISLAALSGDVNDGYVSKETLVAVGAQTLNFVLLEV